MGLVGVRNQDNMALFNDKKPLCVVYYSLDFEKNPKGQVYQNIKCFGLVTCSHSDDVLNR